MLRIGEGSQFPMLSDGSGLAGYLLDLSLCLQLCFTCCNQPLSLHTVILATKARGCLDEAYDPMADKFTGQILMTVLCITFIL